MNKQRGKERINSIFLGLTALHLDLQEGVLIYK